MAQLCARFPYAPSVHAYPVLRRPTVVAPPVDYANVSVDDLDFEMLPGYFTEEAQVLSRCTQAGEEQDVAFGMTSHPEDPGGEDM